MSIKIVFDKIASLEAVGFESVMHMGRKSRGQGIKSFSKKCFFLMFILTQIYNAYLDPLHPKTNTTNNNNNS